MRGNRPGMGTYGSSKAAIATLTKVWASELEGSGVHVYGISPNARTPMNLASGAAYLKNSLPEDIAPLAVFLLGDRARPLNGRMIRLDDGEVSLWNGGDYGAVLGNRPAWSSDSLAAALLPAVATEAA
jgi:NAD(P)-dependent dehydrogenase (short-subunit alcohol dehydrogenase family)